MTWLSTQFIAFLLSIYALVVLFIELMKRKMTMLEPTTRQTSDATIVPATIVGYALLSFPKQPSGKPSIDSVTGLVQQHMLPVIGWKLHGDWLEPLTISPRAADATHYLILPGGKILELNNPATRWNSADQFYQHLLQTWRAAKQMPATDPPQTGFIVSPAAVPSAAIAMSKFF